MWNKGQKLQTTVDPECYQTPQTKHQQCRSTSWPRTSHCLKEGGGKEEYVIIFKHWLLAKWADKLTRAANWWLVRSEDSIIEKGSVLFLYVTIVYPMKLQFAASLLLEGCLFSLYQLQISVPSEISDENS